MVPSPAERNVMNLGRRAPLLIGATAVVVLFPAIAVAAQSAPSAQPTSPPGVVVADGASPSAAAASAAAPPSADVEVADTLGAVYSAQQTTFRIWSPDSSEVSLDVGGSEYSLNAVEVEGYSQVYQVVVEGDLLGRSYQFSINGEPVRDPYARMVDPGTERGVVVDAASVLPSAGAWYPTPELAEPEDSVIYELHVRDYTIDASSGVDEERRGTYLGLVQTGTTHQGVATGLDHLKELGVTHVQLMPTQDFSTAMYNWGYDPVNFSVPEEQYSQFTDPTERIREFQDLVNEFHRNGIRVILDVVYNHTATGDVLADNSASYYTDTDLSGVGNSLDDSQPMVSRMIRDSLETWVRDYHVDGFRFDLIGVHGAAQVADWADYLNQQYPNRNLLIYGEPWNGGVGDPAEGEKVRYAAVPTLTEAGVGVFNGTYRDAIRGGTRDADPGYLGGSGDPGRIALGLRGSPQDVEGTQRLADTWTPAFTGDPEQSINYVSVHDDLNLYDKITRTGATGARAEEMDRLAVGIVFTSQGIPLIAEGDEFLRSKVVDGDYERAHNSYNAGDQVNAIHWGDKITNQSVFAYYQALIALRRSTPALRLTSWAAVTQQVQARYDGQLVTARIGLDQAQPDTIVVVNPTGADAGVDLPEGDWHKIFESNPTGTGDRTAAAGTLAVFGPG